MRPWVAFLLGAAAYWGLQHFTGMGVTGRGQTG